MCKLKNNMEINDTELPKKKLTQQSKKTQKTQKTEYEPEIKKEDKIEEKKTILSILSQFGTVKIEATIPNTISSNFGITKQIALDHITSTIKSMMDGKYDHVNIILVEICLKQFVTNIEDIHNLIIHIYNVLSDCTKEFVITLQKQLENTQFNLDDFLSLRTKYFVSTAKLGSAFRPLIDVTSMRKNNILKIMRDYVFYEQILNHQYLIDGQTKYLFSALTHIIDKNDKKSITDLFKIINTYNGFSHSVKYKKTRSLIFNPVLDSEEHKLMLSDQLLNEYSALINDDIIKLYKSSDNEEKKVLINQIIDNIYMIQRISNPKLFMEQYHKNLQLRLLNSLDERELNHNVSIESIFVKLLKESNFPEIYAMINFSINDVKAAELINNEFRNVTIKFQTDKYHKEFQESFDRTKIYTLVLRELSWDQTMNNRTLDHVMRINEPIMFKNYLDMFEDFYSKFFMSRMSKYACRDITYSYECSTVCMDLEINNKIYNLFLNFIQACVLNYIVDNENISANDLALKMNMKLATMNNDINALLLSGIITRDKTIKADETSITFSVNMNFHSDQLNINIPSFLQNAKELLKLLIQNNNNSSILSTEQKSNTSLSKEGVSPCDYNNNQIEENDKMNAAHVDSIMEEIEKEMLQFEASTSTAIINTSINPVSIDPFENTTNEKNEKNENKRMDIFEMMEDFSDVTEDECNCVGISNNTHEIENISTHETTTDNITDSQIDDDNHVCHQNDNQNDTQNDTQNDNQNDNQNDTQNDNQNDNRNSQKDDNQSSENQSSVITDTVDECNGIKIKKKRRELNPYFELKMKYDEIKKTKDEYIEKRMKTDTKSERQEYKELIKKKKHELNELDEALNIEIEKLMKTKTEKMINAMMETVETMKKRQE